MVPWIFQSPVHDQMSSPASHIILSPSTRLSGTPSTHQSHSHCPELVPERYHHSSTPQSHFLYGPDRTETAALGSDRPHCHLLVVIGPTGSPSRQPLSQPGEVAVGRRHYKDETRGGGDARLCPRLATPRLRARMKGSESASDRCSR